MGLAGAAALTAPSQAAVLTLQGVTANGPGDFTFTYQATIGPDEGVRAGDKFIIYDFGGYIDGSIFAGANFTTAVENTSPGGIVTPGFTDDASIPNLVFTYVGSAFQTTGGPYPSFNFPAIGAHSAFGQTILDAFFSLTTKNNPPSEAERPVFTLGSVSVPFNAIPEPSSWAMMLGGFTLLGAATRRRRTVRVTA